MPVSLIRAAAAHTPDCAVAVREATHDSFHGAIPIRAALGRELFESRPGTRSPGRRRAGPVCLRAHRAGAGRKARRASPGGGQGDAIVAAAQVPADQMLEIGDVGHQRAGELVLHATLRQGRREQVGDGREAGRLFVPGGQLGKLDFRDRPGLVEDRQDLLAPVQERRPVEVAEGFEVAAIAGLALGDGDEQIVADHLAQRAVLAPRLVFAPLGKPPGHLQTAAAELVQARQPPPAVFVGALRDRLEKSAISASAQAVRPSLRQTVDEMIGEIEQIPDVVERVVELGRTERPMPPVGARLAAGQADAQHLPDQVYQR